MIKYIVLIFLLSSFIGHAQDEKEYRNGQLDKVLTPFRLPMPKENSIKYLDLDKDGDPDILQSTLPNGIKVQWIDDDDDMKNGDIEGDLDNDCVMIDLNNDGKYGSELDLIIDWVDEDGDGKADLQAIVDNGAMDFTGKWESHYIWFLDNDGDGVFSYIDWDELSFEGWDHSGRANFFADYNGKSTMLKVHITTWNLRDLTYNWENPFLWFDPDQDGLTEMAIRLVDEPYEIADRRNPKQKWDFSHKISMVQMTFDMDNDTRPENELDYDMSLKFKGKGFDYSNQVHKYNNLKGLPAANKFFEDDRWRRLNQLIYPDHKTAYDLTFEKGEWQECWLVFDEDDDCQRWERVEFYDNKDPFKIGTKNGGLDHNPQADPAGDRGEWDTDFSGKGQLYISPLDCKIHLYGAELGYWRIDQNATYFQGWQGWRGPNLQPEDFDKAEPNLFGTMKYEDTDGNGFMDKISMDLDGDHVFETVKSLISLGIDDKADIYNTAKMSYEDYQDLYEKMADGMWGNAMNGVKAAEKYGLNTEWYAVYKSNKSLREKYNNGFWLSFYLYGDLINYAKAKGNTELEKQIDKAYFSTAFETLL